MTVVVGCDGGAEGDMDPVGNPNASSNASSNTSGNGVTASAAGAMNTDSMNDGNNAEAGANPVMPSGGDANGASGGGGGAADTTGNGSTAIGGTGDDVTVTGEANGGSGMTGAGGSAGDSAGGGNGGEETAAGGGAADGGSGAGTEPEGEEPISCDGSTLTAGNENRTVDVGGTKRSFILHVPVSYDGSTPAPLVLDFHGLGGNGMQQLSSSGYQGVSDQEGFLVAAPDGIDNAWNIGPCCTDSRDVDDLGFAKAIVESVAAAGCVDLKRVYSTGFSMGGGMSHYLACVGADFIAAAAPASFDLITETDADCSPSRPISVLSTRGTNDTVVPFAGGQGSGGRITFLGAEQTLERWVEIVGCTDETVEHDGCVIHTDCTDGVQEGLCTVQGGSHAPGDARTGWDFLSQFSLP
jgi:polyhydroxybutyrate depolymerase